MFYYVQARVRHSLGIKYFIWFRQRLIFYVYLFECEFDLYIFAQCKILLFLVCFV